MNKKYLYLQIEIFSRDFPTRFLKSLYAVSQNFEIILAPLHIISKLAHENKIPPGIIHTKDANSTKKYRENFSKLKSKKFIITSHDEEAGALQKNYEDFYYFRLRTKSFDYLDKFFCWGLRDYNFLRDSIKIPENKIVLSGSSRVDVWRSGVSQININSGIYKKYQNKIILISSNIGSLLSIRPLSERVSQIYYKYATADKVMLDREFGTQAYNTLMLYEYIKLIQYLTKELRDYLIVLRPHPIEKSDDWIQLLNIKSNNFIIGDSYSLIDWINISNLIINNGCTASVEGHFAKKKIINFHPNIPYRSKVRDADVDLASRIGVIMNTKEEIINFIKSDNLANDIQYPKEISSKINKEINFRISNDENQNYKKFIDIWDKLILINNLVTNKEISTYRKKNKFLSFQTYKKIIKKLLIYFIPTLNQIFKIDKTPFDHKFPEFNLDQISIYKDLLCKQFNINSNIKIKKLDTHIIKVYK